MEDLAQTKEELTKKLSSLSLEIPDVKKPTKTCGFCAYYKTPKCLWSDQEGHIKKTDVACSDFFLDRHLRKPLKVKVVERRIGKR
jgi:hypothetical protein